MCYQINRTSIISTFQPGIVVDSRQAQLILHGRHAFVLIWGKCVKENEVAGKQRDESIQVWMLPSSFFKLCVLTRTVCLVCVKMKEELLLGDAVPQAACVLVV